MRSIIFLSFLVFAMSNRDLLVELESSAKPVPVIKCLIQDKNAFVLITKILSVYPEVEAEVKRCLKEEGINLQSFVTKLPMALKKIWDSLPNAVKKEILDAIINKGREVARKLCYKYIYKHKEICSYI